ncbi:MAG: glycosyltransferase family 2 protein [Muribaculaceae bacterium]|nr:glycosyltransferase family 2 protein [Muribaculaceae bacterium]
MEETQPSISIIVPVYNVERYLQQCLEAISNQTFKDWECIIVDDGSTDGSVQICDLYTGLDPRFKVIHKSNGGLSSARNTALDKAKGKFIAFIDSDDWPESHYLMTMHNLITKYEADVVQCGFQRVFKSYKREKPLVDKECVISKEKAILSLLDSSRLPCFVWNKLFRREIITDKFPINQNFEDAYTVPLWFKHINKMVMSPEIVYNYRMRKGSISNSKVAKNQYDYAVSEIHLADNVKESVPQKFGDSSYCGYLQKVFIGAAKTTARREKDKNVRHATIQKLSTELNKITKGEIPKDLGLKKRFRAYMLLNKPLTFETIMRIVNTLDFHARFRRNQLFE